MQKNIIVQNAAPLGAAQGFDLLEVKAPAATGSVRRLVERGLTTTEYAIGLLGAATFALLLLRIVKDNRLFEMLFKWVTRIFTQMAGAE